MRTPMNREPPPPTVVVADMLVAVHDNHGWAITRHHAEHIAVEVVDLLGLAGWEVRRCHRLDVPDRLGRDVFDDVGPRIASRFDLDDDR